MIFPSNLSTFILGIIIASNRKSKNTLYKKRLPRLMIPEKPKEAVSK